MGQVWRCGREAEWKSPLVQQQKVCQAACGDISFACLAHKAPRDGLQAAGESVWGISQSMLPKTKHSPEFLNFLRGA